MKVTFAQCPGVISPNWIVIRWETEKVCTQILTSRTFNPYPELYTGLGKVGDNQLPAKMVIDEEGYGVELIAEVG